LFDLKQAAKRLTEEGLNTCTECMRDTKADWSQRLRAIEIIFAYGYGKPQVTIEADVTHKFAVVPAVLSKEEWLKEAEVAQAEQAAKRIGESPTGRAGHSNGTGRCSTSRRSGGRRTRC
jgi:hypothetical protein